MAVKYEYLNLVETSDGFHVFCTNQDLIENIGKTVKEKFDDTSINIVPNCCEAKLRQRHHWDKLLFVENLLGAEGWEMVTTYNERLIYKREK